jgi:peptidoglycan/LPS O-acetylase OafA/YrhL
MTPHFSAYLDLVRIACAVLVVLSHLGHGHLVGAFLWPFTSMGNEAVMAFFVLSGFIIAYVTDAREKTLQDYALARLARLYSVILPAMALTLFLDTVGTSVNAASYVRSKAFSEGSPLVAYGLSGLMLNQSWAINEHFGSNGAYWSIAYEFWYYAIFGACIFFSGVSRLVFMLLAALIAGPRILALMPVWLLGVALYRSRNIPRPDWVSALTACGGLLVLFGMLWVEYASGGKAGFLGIAPNSLGWQYLFGCCIAAHLFGVSRYTHLLHRFFTLVKRPMKWAADSTLALYLFHLPVVAAIHAVMGQTGRSVIGVAALIVLPFALALSLGYWCEKQKRPLRMVLLKIFHRFGLRPEPGL